MGSRGGERMGSLRLKMAAPIVMGMLLLAAAGWWTTDRVCEANLVAISRVAIRTAAENLVDMLRTSSEDMGAMLGALARDRELTRAVAARDHRRLLALAGPTYQEFRARHGITHWNYWEREEPGAEGAALRNVIRFGTPAMHGDLVERVTLARVSREKALVTGVELGHTGFALRALAPVRDGERVVGYAELGREVGTFLSGMKSRSGDDFGLVLDKRFIDARRWASARAAHGERNDWNDRDDLLLVRDTTHGGVFADPAPPDALPDGGTALGLASDGGRTFVRGAFPLHDVSGRKIAAVYVLRDVTELVTEVRRVRRNGVAALGAIAVVLAAVVGAVFEVLVIRGAMGPSPERRKLIAIKRD